MAVCRLSCKHRSGWTKTTIVPGVKVSARPGGQAVTGILILLDCWTRTFCAAKVEIEEA